MNFSLKNKKEIIILLAVVIFGLVAYSLVNENKEQKEIQKRLLEEQVNQLTIQNELKQQELELAEAKEEKQEKKDLVEKEQLLINKQCYAKALETIYPYYGYNENAYKMCLEFMANNGTFTFEECNQKRIDRKKELEAMEIKAKNDCGL